MSDHKTILAAISKVVAAFTTHDLVLELKKRGDYVEMVQSSDTWMNLEDDYEDKCKENLELGRHNMRLTAEITGCSCDKEEIEELKADNRQIKVAIQNILDQGIGEALPHLAEQLESAITKSNGVTPFNDH